MAYGVTCKQCGSRFALPDDLFERKVKGRVVTVRCKRCQEDISVDGVELASSPSTERPEALDESSIDSGPGEDGTPTVPLTMPKPTSVPPAKILWVVSFAADDDRELTAPQIRRALERGEIDTDTIVWREGMADWLPIADVAELADLQPLPANPTGGFLGTGLEVRGAEAALQAALAKAKGKRPTLAPPPSSPGASKLEGTSASKESSESSSKSEDGTDEAPRVVAAPGVVAADVARLEGDASPPSSVPVSITDDEIELVDSMPKLTKPSPRPPPARPGKPKQLRPDEVDDEDDAPVSGTPDLRSLTTSLAPGPRPKPKKDEPADDGLFALSAGSLVEPALAPPTIDLSNLEGDPAEPAEATESSPSSKRTKKRKPDRPQDSRRSPKRHDSEAAAVTSRSMPATKPTEAEPPTRSNTLWWLLGAAAAVLVVLWFRREPDNTTTAAEPTATAAEPTSTPPATAEPAPQETETLPVLAPTTKQDDTAPELAPPSQVAPVSQPVAKLQEPPTKAPPVAEDPEPQPPPAETPTATEPAKEAPVAGPFDRAAALAALTSSAGAASACRQEGDPTGTATVVVTFAPSGRVTSATVSGPPFAGTRTGGCIASTMRRSRIPPFTGSGVTVSRTVSIQ